MKKQLETIKENLESTLEGFKDAHETEGYDLGNEKYYVETALKQINLLLSHDVNNSCLLDKSKILLKYDYNKMLNGKWHLTEKELDRVLCVKDSKEELIDYVLNNYC